MTDHPDSILLAPTAKAGAPSIVINLGHWAELEARIMEVAAVTPTKAPELLATFNRAALDLNALATQLELEHQLAVREAEKIRAQVLLDRVPKVLVEKGIATAKNPMGSEDLRNAVLAQDKEYEKALECADQLKALTKLIWGKYDAFERAFRSVRTLVGEQSFNFSSLPARDLSHGGGGPKEVGITTKSTNQGFGKPKY